MQQLDQHQRHAIGREAFPTEGIDQRGEEAVPLAHDLGQTQGQGQQRQQSEAAGIEQAGQVLPATEPGIRAPQRHAEEQIVVQQPLQAAALLACPPLGQVARAVPAGGLEQLVIEQEACDLLHVLAAQLQSGTHPDRLGNRRGVIERPALQDLEGGPVDAEETIAHRVVQRPARLAIGHDGTRQQVQLLAQLRQAHGYHPIVVRMLASGRRSIQ
ncbi:hypothetical protein D3C80_1048920 [compost metagenome]